MWFLLFYWPNTLVVLRRRALPLWQSCRFSLSLSLHFCLSIEIENLIIKNHVVTGKMVMVISPSGSIRILVQSVNESLFYLPFILEIYWTGNIS